VDFDAPVGYKEPNVEPKKEESVESMDVVPEPAGFLAFGGAGIR